MSSVSLLPVRKKIGSSFWYFPEVGRGATSAPDPREFLGSKELKGRLSGEAIRAGAQLEVLVIGTDGRREAVTC